VRERGCAVRLPADLVPDDLASDDRVDGVLVGDDLVDDDLGSEDLVVDDDLGSEDLVVDDLGVVDRVVVSRERVGCSDVRDGVRLMAERVVLVVLLSVVGGRYGSTFERVGPRGTITRAGCVVDALRSRV
jgi:hypothetical protein